MNIIREPKVYLVGRQSVDDAAIGSFLSEYGMAWQTDTEVGAEMLA
ncbi:MAG: thymidylate synthase (FAD), partial [Pseudomonas stutzeri]|nr:thymidylate synthase (FAD) [Stutzerimonas stutzeri]